MNFKVKIQYCCIITDYILISSKNERTANQSVNDLIKSGNFQSLNHIPSVELIEDSVKVLEVKNKG